MSDDDKPNSSEVPGAEPSLQPQAETKAPPAARKKAAPVRKKSPAAPQAKTATRSRPVASRNAPVDPYQSTGRVWPD